MGVSPSNLRDGRLEPRDGLGVKSQLELGVDKVGAGGGVAEAPQR
jgi:hypothetical protein